MHKRKRIKLQNNLLFIFVQLISCVSAVSKISNERRARKWRKFKPQRNDLTHFYAEDTKYPIHWNINIAQMASKNYCLHFRSVFSSLTKWIDQIKRFFLLMIEWDSFDRIEERAANNWEKWSLNFTFTWTQFFLYLNFYFWFVHVWLFSPRSMNARNTAECCICTSI